MDVDGQGLSKLGFKVLGQVECGVPTSDRPALPGLLLERSSKLHSDRQQGGDALTIGGVLYIKCMGECCAARPLELHSAGGCIFSGNAFEAHAGRSYRKKWRETIRVLPSNVSLKSWLASMGRDGARESERAERMESREVLMEAAVAAVAAAAAAVAGTAGAPAATRLPQPAQGAPLHPPQAQVEQASAATDATGSARSAAPGTAAARNAMAPASTAAAELQQEQCPTLVSGDSAGSANTLVQQLMQQLQQTIPGQQEQSAQQAAVVGSPSKLASLGSAQPLLQVIAALAGSPALTDPQQAEQVQQKQQPPQQQQQLVAPQPPMQPSLVQLAPPPLQPPLQQHLQHQLLQQQHADPAIWASVSNPFISLAAAHSRTLPSSSSSSSERMAVEMLQEAVRQQQVVLAAHAAQLAQAHNLLQRQAQQIVAQQQGLHQQAAHVQELSGSVEALRSAVTLLAGKQANAAAAAAAPAAVAAAGTQDGGGGCIVQPTHGNAAGWRALQHVPQGRELPAREQEVVMGATHPAAVAEAAAAAAAAHPAPAAGRQVLPTRSSSSNGSMSRGQGPCPGAVAAAGEGQEAEEGLLAPTAGSGNVAARAAQQQQQDESPPADTLPAPCGTPTFTPPDPGFTDTNACMLPTVPAGSQEDSGGGCGASSGKRARREDSTDVSN